MNSRVMHSVYLPFDEKTLATIASLKSPDIRNRDIPNLITWPTIETPSSGGAPIRSGGRSSSNSPGEATRGLQIEKDERFWVVAALMALFYSEDAPAAFASLLRRSGLDAPPGRHSTRTWKDVLTGDLHLWFEVALGSPRDYHDYLRPRLDERVRFLMYARRQVNRAFVSKVLRTSTPCY